MLDSGIGQLLNLEALYSMAERGGFEPHAFLGQNTPTGIYLGWYAPTNRIGGSSFRRYNPTLLRVLPLRRGTVETPTGSTPRPMPRNCAVAGEILGRYGNSHIGKLD